MSQRINYLPLIFVIMISLLLDTAAQALESDRKQPAKFVLDSLTYNRTTGIGIYSGRVSIIQGTTQIQANKIVSYNDQNNKLIKAIATGSPVLFQTQPKPNEPLVHAIADSMQYEPVKNTVIMSGHVTVTQGSNKINSAWISYDMKNGIVNTKNTANDVKAQRTTIIIQPQTK